MIRRIMTEYPTAEVFLTLAVDHIAAHAKTAGEALGRLKDALSLEPELEAFLSGRRDMDETAALSKEDRSRLMRFIQCFLHETFAKKAGAKFYTPFFITSKGSHRSYWFLHLANSSRANDVVKELHWGVSNHFEHFGREGMMMLGFNPDEEQGPDPPAVPVRLRRLGEGQDRAGARGGGACRAPHPVPQRSQPR